MATNKKEGSMPEKQSGSGNTKPVAKKSSTRKPVEEKIITTEIAVVNEETAVKVEYNRTNILAIISFVTAFLFFIPFNSIISIILGHLALNDIKNNPNQDGATLATAGLLISYIFVALVFLGIIFIVGLFFLALISATILV